MFFDAHSHTQFAAFERDCEEVIDRAIALGVWMIIVGTQKDTSRRAIDVAQRYPEGVYASVGLHPIHTEQLLHDAKELDFLAASTTEEQQESQVFSVRKFRSRGEEFDYNYYRQLAQSPKVLTIGECGLDYYRLGGETKPRQRKAFERQIQLSSDVKKPLMIHCRSAFGDLIDILAANSKSLVSPTAGIIHFFTGARVDAKVLLDLGFRFTFG